MSCIKSIVQSPFSPAILHRMTLICNTAVAPGINMNTVYAIGWVVQSRK